MSFRVRVAEGKCAVESMRLAGHFSVICDNFGGLCKKTEKCILKMCKKGVHFLSSPVTPIFLDGVLFSSSWRVVCAQSRSPNNVGVARAGPAKLVVDTVLGPFLDSWPRSP